MDEVAFDMLDIPTGLGGYLARGGPAAHISTNSRSHAHPYAVNNPDANSYLDAYAHFDPDANEPSTVAFSHSDTRL